MNSPGDNERLDAIVDLIVELASGNLNARLQPSAARDSIDAVITGINLLADELADVHVGLEQRVAERTRMLLAAQNDLRTLALQDPLTGLANRTLLGDRIEQAVNRAEHGGIPPAVLLLDLDEFKTINDSLGHLAGDAVLVEVARRLNAVIRESDTVARLGGDEFAVLMPDATEDEAFEVAKAALAAVRQPVTAADRTVWACASLGLRLGERGLTADMMLRDADTAMYAAKANGRGNIQIFRPAMHLAVQQRLELASDMATAIRCDQLVLHYQPIVNLIDQSLVGVEALIRWNHPDLGLMMPADFVPIAEDSGLIIELGKWVMHEAVAQIAEWENRLPADFLVHVNISPIELRRSGLVDDVADLLAEHGVSPARLALEISESGLMTGDEDGLQTLLALRTMGVRIEIDDFGTGYSSISYLRDLPIDAVKVDRSLIIDIEADERQRRMVGAVLALIEAAGLEAIAEGVETVAQLHRLTDLGYQFAQGYLFSPAIAAADIGAMLDGRSCPAADETRVPDTLLVEVFHPGCPVAESSAATAFVTHLVNDSAIGRVAE